MSKVNEQKSSKNTEKLNRKKQKNVNSDINLQAEPIVAQNRLTKKAGGWVYALAKILLRPFIFRHYRLKIDRSISKKIKSPCFIVSNHVTLGDQFFVALSFKFPINFVASDFYVRKSLSGRLMRRYARPIPIRKGTFDAFSVKDIMNIIRQKGAVALFPEGNATFYGETGAFKPTIGKMAKKLDVPLVIMNIKGGFNTEPRWKNKKTNKGKMTVSVVKVIERDELRSLTGDQLTEIIGKEIYFNEYDFNRVEKIKFKGKHKAENLEIAIFACPTCHSFVDMASDKNDFFCKKCGARVTFDDYGFLQKVNNADVWPDNIADLSKIQLDLVLNTDFNKYIDTPLFADKDVELVRCKRYQRDELLGSGDIEFFGDRIEVCGHTLLMSDITGSTLTRRRLQIYLSDGDYLAVDCKKGVCLTKYMVASYAINNLRKGLVTETNKGYFGY